MRSVWRDIRGTCPECGHTRKLNPLRGLVAALIILGFTFTLLAVQAAFQDRHAADLAERMAQEAEAREAGAPGQ